MMGDGQHLNQPIDFAVNKVKMKNFEHGERPAFCVLQRTQDGANSSLKKRLNFSLKLFTTHQIDFA